MTEANKIKEGLWDRRAKQKGKKEECMILWSKQKAFDGRGVFQTRKSRVPKF